MRLTFTRWLVCIGVLLGFGMLKVAQQTAIWKQAYNVGTQHTALHALEQDTQWLQRDVLAQVSPAELSRATEQRQLKLVAWSAITPPSPKSKLLARELEE